MLYMGLDFKVDGHEPPDGRDAHRTERAVVDAGFFAAAGIPIVKGRNFTDADRVDAPGVAIISEAMARRFWSDGDVLGRVVRRIGPDGEEIDLCIVGVVANIEVQSLSEPPVSLVYLPYTQVDNVMLNFVARTSFDPEQTALAMVAAGRDLDPQLMVLGNEDDGATLGAPPVARAVGCRRPVDVCRLGAVPCCDRALWRRELHGRVTESRGRHTDGARGKRAGSSFDSSPPAGCGWCSSDAG